MPKKDPRDKRAVGVLTTPLRVMGRLIHPILLRYDRQASDEGDTAIKGGNLDRATYERHAIGILWDIQTLFDSVKAYVAIQRTLRRGWNPAVLIITMWSHRAPRIVTANGSSSKIIFNVPHSLIAGCTSSNSIARAVLPSLREIDAQPLPTHLTTGTALYRHVDDFFQLTWSDTFKGAAIEALRSATPLANAIRGLQLTISSKTSVVAHSRSLADKTTNALKRIGVPAKTEKGWLDCGVYFTGGGKPNKADQNNRISRAHTRAQRVTTACRNDKRASILATTGVQPMQAYGAAAVGTTIKTAGRMRTNVVTAIYGRSAQPCPVALTHAQLRPKNDPMIRIGTKSIEAWTHLWRNAKASTRSLLRSAWTQCLHDHNCATDNIHTVGPITGTIQWVTHVGWKPALPDQWINHTNPNDLQAAHLGQRRSEDTIILKHYTTALTNKIYTAAAAHFGGDGIGQGTPDFSPALDAGQKFRTLDLWPQMRALEGIIHGTAWPNTRLYPHDPPSQICQRCGLEPETPWHRYWTCTKNTDIPDEHGFIAASHFLRLVFTTHPTRYPMCLWARAILPYNLTGADVPPNSVNSYEGSPPEQMIHHHQYVTIYTDGAGYAPRSNRAGQMVGSGGFITASDNAAWGELQAHFATHVPGEQTVPRAEIHAATHALQMFSDAPYVLIITDAEELFLSSTCPTRLHNALAGPNADLWQDWQDAVSQCRGGLTISHVRAHALDDNSHESMKRLQQNKHRRRYRPPAGRPDIANNKDQHAKIRYHDAHDYLWHSLGNTFADAAAGAAQRAALPSGRNSTGSAPMLSWWHAAMPLLKHIAATPTPSSRPHSPPYPLHPTQPIFNATPTTTSHAADTTSTLTPTRGY